MMNGSVSIIIPAYNEAGRIAASLVEVHAFARSDPRVLEVVVVDDGSTDGTADVVSAAAPQWADGGPVLRLVRHPVNQGKGQSVRTGFSAAGGDIVLFSDADLSAPITEAPRLLEPIAANQADIVIGSRALDPSMIHAQQSLVRRNAGRAFNILVRMVTGLPLHDTQCGFKAFRRELAVPVFARQRIHGYAFDVELLYLARRMHLRILELPVHWSHAEGSKVSMWVHGREMGFDLLRIRWNSALGLYRLDGSAGRPVNCSRTSRSPETGCSQG
jgi:glycosyltransferase involved in cell wall biosynthesis